MIDGIQNKKYRFVVSLREELFSIIHLIEKVEVNLDANKYLKWSCDDVIAWLSSLDGGQFASHSKGFKEIGIKGVDLKYIKTKDDLQQFGIKRPEPKTKIFDHLHSLINKQYKQKIYQIKQIPLKNMNNMDQKNDDNDNATDQVLRVYWHTLTFTVLFYINIT